MALFRHPVGRSEGLRRQIPHLQYLRGFQRPEKFTYNGLIGRYGLVLFNALNDDLLQLTNNLHTIGKVVMSVLAHIVSRMGQPEPAATQALTYILQKSQNIARAFVGLIYPPGARFEPGRIDSERGDHNQGIPDIRIHDKRDIVRVLVENKFRAELTENQPVGYLSRLRGDANDALLFIVPEWRVEILWEELKVRCRNAGFNLREEPDVAGVKRAWVEGTKAMLITHWDNVLDTLKGADDGERVQCDILQLRGLAEQVELAPFLPLRNDETTNADAARRMMNYVELIDSIIDRLKVCGLAHADGISHTWRSTGRRLRLRHGGHEFRGWLGVPLRVWRDSNDITPLWWRAESGRDLNPGLWARLETLFCNVQVYGDLKYVPIRLKHDVEREGVIAYAVEQTRRIAEKLEEAMRE